MIRINLLPYRERLREGHRRRFRLLLILAVLVSAALLALAAVAIDAAIRDQGARNGKLEDAINTLNGTLRRAASLNREKQTLIERQQLVEKLQAGRNDAVRLLEQFSLLTPPGVYLKEIKPSQDGQRIIVTGMAQSAERVSAYLILLGQGPMLSDPQLDYLRDPADAASRGSEFSLSVKASQAPTRHAASEGARQ
ncbi:PilN domain-containing protein [Paludibacterium paludis]|uniref:Fimbrial protein n=1 Tax=Paludibacterium paludis TaxID=1225769 RepID=A0A918UAF3_9NEIS|nr:PilN domain-containing protein [Paludibacterium paludis]GGY16536.1 fimbrial protein [Paludibacterium paludis]